MLLKVDLDDISVPREKVTQYYFASLTRGLEAVHSKGFIYRDFKPDNVLIDSKGDLMQTDFEFSEHFEFDLEDLLLVLMAFLAPQFDCDFNYFRACLDVLGENLIGDVVQTSCLELKLNSCFSRIIPEIGSLCERNRAACASPRTLEFRREIWKRRGKGRQRFDQFSRVLQRKGSRQYYSPEIISDARFSFASDYWALGCCIYDLYYQRSLFEQAEMDDILKFEARNMVTSRMSPDAHEIFLQLLSQDPATRVEHFDLSSLFEKKWLSDFADADLAAMEKPYVPAEEMSESDSDDSSFLVVDKVNFEFNPKFKTSVSELMMERNQTQAEALSKKNEQQLKAREDSRSTDNLFSKHTTDSGLQNPIKLIPSKHLVKHEYFLSDDATSKNTSQDVFNLGHSTNSKFTRNAIIKFEKEGFLSQTQMNESKRISEKVCGNISQSDTKLETQKTHQSASKKKIRIWPTKKT